ncbi:MAG: YbaB/EbfC family nucleoid-associated protein [Chloroflexota bacterium]
MINKNMLKQMQAKLAKIQEDLAREEISGTAGGGVVTVVANGQQQLVSVKIDPEAVDPEDVSMLEDLVLAAANEALSKSRDLAAQRLGGLTGGMGIPGF